MEECGELEEGAGRFGKVPDHEKTKRHKGTNPAENDNLFVQHSNSNSEDGYKADNISENLKKRINKTLKENKELKETLTGIMKSLKEAAVTNHNLAQIIKLISENATSQDEKKEIIARFAKEGKTIEASKNLYESINNDLKKSNKMNLTEDKSLTVESSKKINETPIYKSQDIMESLDLMHRMNRI
jgi:coenzyme F420-reducing hydrogenase alpha subunit